MNKILNNFTLQYCRTDCIEINTKGQGGGGGQRKRKAKGLGIYDKKNDANE